MNEKSAGQQGTTGNWTYACRILTALLWAICFKAYAAPGSASSSGAVAGELEDVVVTATKRESTVLNTPISLSVVSEQDIQARGIPDFTSLAQSIPGVSMRTSGPSQTEFEMRGMASFGGNSPTVGFYLDDVPVSGPSFNADGKVVIDPNLYDLNRVEVLRGPQGTLYGSGSMGGTIKLIPNAPDPTGIAASAEAILGDTDGGGFNHGENAMVNIPLGTGTAALRVVGSESHDSGWIDRIVIVDGAFPLETANNTVRGNVLAAPVAIDHKGANNEDLTSVRTTLLWQPTERLTISPSVLYQKIQQDGLGYIDSIPGKSAFYQPFDVPESVLDRFNLYSVTVQYKFDSFALNATTSRWYRESDTIEDSSESLQWAFGIPFYPSQGGLGPVPALEEDQTNQTTQEIRLTSLRDSKFQWLFGYFYSDFQSSYNYIIAAPGAVPLFGTSNLATQYQTVKIIQQAAFGEVSYQLTPTLKATAGVRRYSYTGDVNTKISGALTAGEQGVLVDGFTVLPTTSERNQGANPKFTLSYQPSDKLLLYSTVAKGFRPGGGNQPVPVSGTVGTPCETELQAIYNTNAFVPAPGPFDPDTVWNYEIGEKLKTPGGRVAVNSAVYYENWSGVQQAIPLPCGFAFEANAGDAHIYGGELEVSAVLAQGLLLSLNAGYTHATIATVRLQNAGIETGTRLQDVPDWTSSQSLAYRRPLSDALTLTARVENDYVGTRTDVSYAVNSLHSYNLTNLRVGLEGNHWSGVMFAKNIFNKTVLLNNVTLLAATLPTYNRVVTSQPLTIGIDVNYRFGR